MSNNILILFVYYYLICFSVIGHGSFFDKVFCSKKSNQNIAYIGLKGIFLLIIYSLISHIFIPHGINHNLIIFILGLISFIFFFKNLKDKKNFYLLILILLILFVSLLIFKTHDDFPFYHFPYSYYLTQHPLQVGIGLFNSGFKTPSSIFYLNSLFYLPIIKYYSFYITTVIFMGFSNLIILNYIFDNIKDKKIDYLFYLSLLFFIFINVFFYRIQEHGTDRSAQILILILFLQIFSLINFYKDKFEKIDLIMILIGIIISLKSFYILYLIICIPIFYIFYKKKELNLILYIIQNKIFFLLFLLIFLILLTYYLNSGCLIYPIHQTCFDSLSWSTGSEEVKKMNDWYQQWSKAGATPNFRVENPENYITGFNWLENWIDLYFFNKVLDFLLGILITCIILLITFYNKIKTVKKKKYIFIFYFFIILLFIEWFYNHPTLRYGGYCLIALLFFIPTSLLIEKYNLNSKKVYLKTISIILITTIIFLSRNYMRINDEIEKYSYKPFDYTFYNLDSSHFRIDNEFKKIFFNYENCKKEKKICDKSLRPKIKKLFNNSFIFLVDEKD